MSEKYVCISVQSTAQLKYWNNPGGWDAVVFELMKMGYQVYAIDKDASFGSPERQNRIPYNAQDRTGMSVADTIALLRGASLFMGTSSGLSWLAWAAGVPTVLISGMTPPYFEFTTNSARVHNPRVCNGCFCDQSVTFDRGDWMFCPRHKGTPREFECTKTISAETVMNAVRTMLKNNNPAASN